MLLRVWGAAWFTVGLCNVDRQEASFLGNLGKIGQGEASGGFRHLPVGARGRSRTKLRKRPEWQWGSGVFVPWENGARCRV